MTIATKLSEARELIERGWCQGALATADGCVCIRGALLQVFEPKEYADEARANTLLHMATGFDGYLGDWNDKPERTQAEVIEAFKRAEQLARDGAE